MYASVITAITNIVLNMIFIPLFGFVAAGYTTLVCYGLFALSQFVFMNKACKEAGMPAVYNTKVIWGIATLFVGVSIMISFLYKYTWQRYVTITIIFIVVVSFLVKKKQMLLKIFKKA